MTSVRIGDDGGDDEEEEDCQRVFPGLELCDFQYRCQIASQPASLCRSSQLSNQGGWGV